MRVTAVHASRLWAAELRTEQLEGRHCPVHKDVDVLKFREASNLIKPAWMYKPVQGHVGLNALPALGKCFTICLPSWVCESRNSGRYTCQAMLSATG